MMHVWELYKQFCSEYNTSQSGFFRPATDFVPAIHAISLQLFNKMGPEAYKNQQYADLLTPFVKAANITVQKKPGHDLAPYPKDYTYFSSSRMILEKPTLTAKCERGVPLVNGEEVVLPEHLKEDFFVPEDVPYIEREVRLTESNRWAAVTQHKTKGPKLTDSVQRAFARQREEGFEVLPRGIATVVVDYYRLPKKPVLNYRTATTGPDRVIEFIEAGSEHLEWSEAMTPVFLYYLGKKYGLFTRDELVLQVRNINEVFE